MPAIINLQSSPLPTELSKGKQRLNGTITAEPDTQERLYPPYLKNNHGTWYPRAFVSSISEEQVNSVLLQSIERDKQPPVLIYIYVN